MTKVRAMYGRMLTPAQYEELVHRQNVQEISAYLREKTTYASALGGVQDSTVHRGQLENLLRKDLFYQYVRLLKYVGKNDGVYRYIIMDMEIGLILASLRSIISESGEDIIADIPTFIQPLACFDLFRLVGLQTVEQLAAVLQDTPYGETFRRCYEENPLAGGKQPNYTAYELALRSYYYGTLIRLAGTERGKAREELLRLINTRAELTNINTIFRMKTYFQMSPEQIGKMMLPYASLIRPRALLEMVAAKDAQEFMQLLSRTVYGRGIEADTAYIEGSTDRARLRLDLKTMRFSTHPQVVFMAFMLLRGIETENVIRIIEGVRYRLAPEKIEKLLIRA